MEERIRRVKVEVKYMTEAISGFLQPLKMKDKYL